MEAIARHDAQSGAINEPLPEEGGHRAQSTNLYLRREAIRHHDSEAFPRDHSRDHSRQSQAITGNLRQSTDVPFTRLEVRTHEGGADHVAYECWPILALRKRCGAVSAEQLDRNHRQS